MSLLPVALYGDKILRKKVTKVKEIDVETIKLITDMFETMHNAYGIGLAANQVGADKTIFLVDISEMEGEEDKKPMVIINPKIINRSDETIIMEEGCLSIPEVRGDVLRPKSITLEYQDTDFKKHKIKADGLLARVMQHEYDHLQGILFTDLVADDLKKKLKKPLNNIKRRKVEFEYPTSTSVDYQLI
ncbi:MAG TPA: peptide deformylase [Ignavibacteria bacterium]|nr:peptide deformylase [Ignavibacteria bacterium]